MDTPSTFFFALVPPYFVVFSLAVGDRRGRNDEGEQPVLGGLLRPYPVRKGTREQGERENGGVILPVNHLARFLFCV